MKLKAVRHTQDGKTGWLLNGQKTWTTSAHFAEWYWLGTRTDPTNKHHGITLMLVPLDQEGVTINGIYTMGGVPMGDERTNEVFIDNVFVPDEYVVGEVNKGFQYISQALDLERFTMFTFAPIEQRLDLLTRVRARPPTRDGEPLKDDPVVRAKIARLAHRRRGRPGHGPQVRRRVDEGRARHASRAARRCRRPRSSPPSTSSSPPSSPAGWPTRRWTSAGRAPRLRVKTESAPMAGRAESTYRYTVIDTIGGGASEIQKNIIARRGLGLPKTF